MSGRHVGAPERFTSDVGRAAPFFQAPLGSESVSLLIEARHRFQAICGHIGAPASVHAWAGEGIDLLDGVLGDRP